MAPDSKVHGDNMRPTWVLSAPDGPHVGPMNLAIRGKITVIETTYWLCVTYDLNKTVIYSVGNKKSPLIADKDEKGTK